MKIACDECGQDYNIDESKLTKDNVTMKCRKCSASIAVKKTAPEKAPKKFNDLSVDTQDEKKAGNKDKTIKFGLYPKIILLMLLISLGPLAVFFFSTYNETNNRIKQDTEILMLQTTKGLQGHIDEWVDKNIRILKTAASLPAMQSLNQKKQTQTLKAIQKEYPWMYLVFALDTNGMNTARSDGKNLKNYSDRSYFQNIKNGKPLAWQTLIGKTSGQPALVLSVPMFTNGELTGIIAAAMTTDAISQSVATWKSGKTGYAFLVDEKNKVIAHPKKEYVLKEKNLSNYPIISMNNKNITAFSEFSDENEIKTIGSIQKNHFGWTLVIQQEKREVYETLATFQKYLLLIFISSALIVTLIAWLSAKAIVSPILKMTDATNQMSMGDLNVKIEIKSYDEIALLANSITRMQTSLVYAMNRLKKKK